MNSFFRERMTRSPTSERKMTICNEIILNIVPPPDDPGRPPYVVPEIIENDEDDEGERWLN